MEFRLGVRSLLLVIVLVFWTGSMVCGDNGLAVYYDPPYTRSACGNVAGGETMIAGVSRKLWNGRAACGKQYTVRCLGPANASPIQCRSGQAITVKIVDLCEDPCNGDINLSRDAFSKIADPTVGKIRIEYNQA